MTEADSQTSKSFETGCDTLFCHVAIYSVSYTTSLGLTMRSASITIFATETVTSTSKFMTVKDLLHKMLVQTQEFPADASFILLTCQRMQDDDRDLGGIAATMPGSPVVQFPPRNSKSNVATLYLTAEAAASKMAAEP